MAVFEGRYEKRSPVLRKALGQHHLVDRKLCRPAVEFLQPMESPVLEIGSGGGVLTHALVDAGARVVGLDLDLAWLAAGRRRLKRSGMGQVRWLASDALEFDWRRLPADWSVAGNLPYNVATPMIRSILENGHSQRMVFLVQKEVAQRMISAVNSKNYGLLSLVVEWWAEASVLSTVKPGSFNPPPRVDSQFVGLLRRAETTTVTEYRRVMRVASLAFRHRRKTLPNALRQEFKAEQVVNWAIRSHLSPKIRPQELTLKDYRSLASTLIGEPISPTE